MSLINDSQAKFKDEHKVVSQLQTPASTQENTPC